MKDMVSHVRDLLKQKKIDSLLNGDSKVITNLKNKLPTYSIFILLKDNPDKSKSNNNEGWIILDINSKLEEVTRIRNEINSKISNIQSFYQFLVNDKIEISNDEIEVNNLENITQQYFPDIDIKQYEDARIILEDLYKADIMTGDEVEKKLEIIKEKSFKEINQLIENQISTLILSYSEKILNEIYSLKKDKIINENEYVELKNRIYNKNKIEIYKKFEEILFNKTDINEKINTDDHAINVLFDNFDILEKTDLFLGELLGVRKLQDKLEQRDVILMNKNSRRFSIKSQKEIREIVYKKESNEYFLVILEESNQ